MASSILGRTSGLEPSSKTTAPRYLKLVVVPTFSPFTLISLWMPLFVINFGLLSINLQTRFAFTCILQFSIIAHKPACPTLSKAFFGISEDKVQILLMLEVLFTQDFKAEDLFCGAPSGYELWL